MHNDGQCEITVRYALNSIAENIESMQETQRMKFLYATGALVVSVMREIHGEQFVRDYLTEAIADLDKPPIFKLNLVH